MGDEYYERLGVASDASAEEIAAAYRKRLKKAHPDVSNASDAKERTKQLIEAKEVLTDETERTRYDRLGHERYVRVERGEAPEPNSTSSTESSRTASDPGGTASRSTRDSTTASDPGGTASGATGTDGHSRRSGGRRHPGDGHRPGGKRGRDRRSREYVGDGVDWDEWSETDWDAVSDAVWEEVTGDSADDVRSGRDPGPGSAPNWGGNTSGGTAGAGQSGPGVSNGPGQNGGAATARPGGASRAAGPGKTATETSQASGDSTVGWYQGGDPSGTGPNSWSVGGTLTDPWSGWRFGSNGGAGYGTVPPRRILSPIQTAVLTLLCFAAFPLLVAGSVFPNFDPATRVVFATFLVFVVAVLIILSQLGVVVFGSWTVLFPVAFAHFGVPLFSPYGAVVLGAAVLSLGLAGLSWLLTRPHVT
jgi:molecular chaperone DnaJ